MTDSPFSHLDDDGSARMVDVGDKATTARSAIAEGAICMPSSVIDTLSKLPKGNAFEVARIAGIMAAKRTQDLIPLCHGLNIDSVQVDFDSKRDRVVVRATACCHGKTGVEMEALTAVSTALLTLYDMTKSATKQLTLTDIRLLEKRGGRSGTWRNPACHEST